MKIDRARERQRVVFLHIPKTAGSTLYGIIDRHYKAKTVYTIGIDGSIDDFKNLSAPRRSMIRVLRGHHGFGLYQFLSGPSIHFTLLRDPVDRVISYYYFIRRRPKNHLHDFVMSNDMDLKGFIESGIPVMANNGQTRLLSGKMDKAHEVAFGECTEEALESAKSNLREHFTVVGLTERFDETLLLLREAFGWLNLFYARQKVAPNRPRKDELSKSTLDAITRVNLLDIELYDYATALFEQQARQQGPTFSREVKLFQQANQRMEGFIRLCWRFKSVSIREFVRRAIRLYLNRQPLAYKSLHDKATKT